MMPLCCSRRVARFFPKSLRIVLINKPTARDMSRKSKAATRRRTPKERSLSQASVGWVAQTRYTLHELITGISIDNISQFSS